MKSARRQSLVKVSGIDGVFATKTGGEVTAELTKAWDGGRLSPDNIPGPASAANIVVSRPFDPERDQESWKTLGQLVGRFEATLSVTPTDRDLNPIAEPDVYPEALLVRRGARDYDAASGDPDTYELEFAVGAWS